MIFIDEVVKNLINILFPRLCLICQSVMGDNEMQFCSCCRHDLPLLDHVGINNPVEKILSGRVDLAAGASLLRFEKKGIVQQLLHNLKYKGYKEISTALGSWLGSRISHDPRFKNIDIVIPVPLHRSRLRKRGYNQVEDFGREIAYRIRADYVDDLLLKKISTPTKVFQKRHHRWQDKKTVFSLRQPDRFINKKVLLVDDIITTGATIEACSTTLKLIPGVKISVATMAIAD